MECPPVRRSTKFNIGGDHLRVKPSPSIGPVGTPSFYPVNLERCSMSKSIGLVKTTVSVKDDLIRKGFSYLKGSDLYLPSRLEQGLLQLQNDAMDLPPDNYAEDRTRYRRYHRFTRHPSGLLLPQPPDEEGYHHYYQPQVLNPVNGGIVRKFKAFSPRMIENEFLIQLMLFDLAQTIFPDAYLPRGIEVGVHIIKMLARPGRAGISSPDRLHKDGEHYTFIHLLERRNITGGESEVADNSKRLLFQTVLCNRLDTLAVRDDVVYHNVKRIYVDPPALEGSRTVILVDLTPLKPDIHIND
jgi:hypothetical protein